MSFCIQQLIGHNMQADPPEWRVRKSENYSS